MNYLAHIYLARYSDEAMLGALLGDFVKPNSGAQFSPDTEAEILLHRKVDTFTDSHPVVLAAKGLFDGPGRRYSGILLDVFYDHVLTLRWARYSDVPLPDFIARFYGALDTHAGVLPPNLARIAPYMIEQDWLGSYQSYAGIDIAIRRISTRLSKNGDVMRDALHDLKRHAEAIADGFDVFFPELITFVESQRNERQ
ncbi:acyl carrier protein phosphodiesterase [Massilia pseudoviolaceinigra]|uniref:acyl carrier protein phosphodiesterase n=1 Tax=Massilia pseudoviolaceinigra TaxID=3057165 RepID=UPI00279661B9|nr:ACP phosphodiesterase [Massilia sp. CCM 9206]MDQ1923343.1 ACP phosphodiesterase [Massilia sp. CCM 9206]